jgi:ribose 5-phosphate isomerase B
LYVSSDHAGFGLRQALVAHLRRRGHEVIDFGAPTATAVDYPDEALKVARAVRDDASTRGVLLCGSGVGVCIAANKVRGVRAVDAWNLESARLSRAHNDANVLCLGARLVGETEAFAIADAWLETAFEGGRHERRVEKITSIETREAAASVPPTTPRGNS